jgi:hypothetical protein
MSKFDDAITELKSAVFAEFSDAWHHHPKKKSVDVNNVSETDYTRPYSDFCGIFFAPPSMQDINSMISGSLNMPTVEAKKNNVTIFKKYDYISNRKGLIYEICAIRESTRNTVILELKYIGHE